MSCATYIHTLHMHILFVSLTVNGGEITLIQFANCFLEMGDLLHYQYLESFNCVHSECRL